MRRLWHTLLVVATLAIPLVYSSSSAASGPQLLVHDIRFPKPEFCAYVEADITNVGDAEEPFGWSITYEVPDLGIHSTFSGQQSLAAGATRVFAHNPGSFPGTYEARITAGGSTASGTFTCLAGAPQLFVESVQFPDPERCWYVEAGVVNNGTAAQPAGWTIFYRVPALGISTAFPGQPALGVGEAYVFTYDPGPAVAGPHVVSIQAGGSAFAIAMTCPRSVNIDIRPGASLNTINLGANGVVPVAVLGDAELDASEIDPGSVSLASAEVQVKGNGTTLTRLEDVNGDGYLDLVVHVSVEALQLSQSDSVAVLRARTFGGQLLRGTDIIRVVPAP